MPTLLLLILLQFPFLLQEKHTIPKGFKAPYESALIEYEKAVQSLDEGDSFEAIEFLDRIISNKKVESKYREVKLRIEKQLGTHGPWTDFYPYQLRGRARLARAQMTVEHDQARRHLQLAKKDFQESVDRGLKSSEDLLAQTVQKLEERKEPPVIKDLEPEFRNEWEKLIENHHYSSAKSWIESNGEFLPTEKQRNYAKETDQRCLKYIEMRTLEFLDALENNDRDSILVMKSGTFGKSFSKVLPLYEDLSTTTPTYDWCQRIIQVLGAMRNQKKVLAQLIDLAITALPLVPKEENGWYRWAEGLAYSIVKEILQKTSLLARDADKARRTILQKQSLEVEKVWQEFQNKTKGSAPFPPRNVGTLIDFPKDYPGIETLQDDVEKALSEVNFINALQDFEKMHQSPKGNLTIESRREILRCRIAANALLRLYENGGKYKECAIKLKDMGEELKRLKGSFIFERFGPRVKKVFQELGRPS